MLFNSFEFLVFFPVVVGLYFACPYRFRWALLLGASYYFYGSWNWKYLGLIVASTLIDYVAARGMAATDADARRKLWLFASLAGNLGILFTFKYYNFFRDSAEELLTRLGLESAMPAADVLLPVGISFYTFQSLSYTIDVFTRKREPERHLGRFALYVAFFPQLVAGPIERSTRLLPQLAKNHDFEYQRVTHGIKQMGWGLVKKIVIADNLALLVDAVYASPEDHSAVTLAVATLAFAFQIYCDFSGYSDIAIGSARVMGIELMQNFDRPYFARSVGEFWRRWHISLSTWFRDYVYIPLGGGRVAQARLYGNLMAVFLLSGLWHGANWTFVCWGAVHGGCLVLSRATESWRRFALPQPVQILITFTMIYVAWVFFRAQTLADAQLILTQLAAAPIELLYFDAGQWWSSLPAPAYNTTIGFAGIAALLVIEVVQAKRPVLERLALRPTWQRWIVYSAALWVLILFGNFGAEEFLYFAF
jgi:alginate O-acetyltransferase complex protein AlgI